VKKFLKEKGGADLYPLLKIEWSRGHSPTLIVGPCIASTGPDAKLGGQSIDLSPYTSSQLHSLIQCQGLMLRGEANDTNVPIPMPTKQDCIDLAPKPKNTWVGVAAVIGLLALAYGLVIVLMCQGTQMCKPSIRCCGRGQRCWGKKVHKWKHDKESNGFHCDGGRGLSKDLDVAQDECGAEAIDEPVELGRDEGRVWRQRGVDCGDAASYSDALA